MTPKERAEELVNKFIIIIRCKMGQEDIKERAKQCALIVVEHCLITAKYMNETSNYWQEVKLEIEKL